MRRRGSRLIDCRNRQAFTSLQALAVHHHHLLITKSLPMPGKIDPVSTLYQSPAHVAPLPPTLLEFGKNKLREKHMLCFTPTMASSGTHVNFRNDKFSRSLDFARTLSFENCKNNGNPLARGASWYLDISENNQHREGSAGETGGGRGQGIGGGGRAQPNANYGLSWKRTARGPLESPTASSASPNAGSKSGESKAERRAVAHVLHPLQPSLAAHPPAPIAQTQQQRRELETQDERPRAPKLAITVLDKCNKRPDSCHSISVTL